MVLRLLLLFVCLIGTAQAAPEATRDSMERLEELLRVRIEDGRIDIQDIVPALLVSTQVKYQGSEEWFATRAIEVLQRTVGTEIRLCEACMAPRAFAEDGRVAYQTGPIGIDEIIRLDEQLRGNAQPAKSAVWIDEHENGVAVRIVDLRSSRVLYAQNVDPLLIETRRSKRMYSYAEEYERRAKGFSLAQGFVDLALYPRQHISLEWTDQWGKRNQNLTGFTFSIFDPVIGIGATHARRFKVLNMLIGAKVIIAVPQALIRVLSDVDLGNDGPLDPLLTGVAYVRVPIGRSNYGIFASASTNGNIGVGLSLMNVSLIPVIL